MLPQITIITPSYQQAAFLAECLRSVQDQGYPELEHIVVDGGSTDGSKAIIERYQDRLSWWCSEPDGGQSAAINKGLARASGTIFGWLNSDDLLLPGALHAVAEAFAADPELVMVTGARIRRHPDGREEFLEAEPADDPERWFVDPRTHQASTFYRMDAVRTLGGVEEGLHYVMDLELWWQLLFRHGPGMVRVLPQPLSVFRLHADSKTIRSQAAFVDETAGLLHGLCQLSGQLELSRVLGTGYEWPSGLRIIPIDTGQTSLIRKMVLDFLLHWNRVIFTERQFRMMRRLRDAVAPVESELSVVRWDTWQGILRQVDVPAWWLFRMRRKLNFWTGSGDA